VKTKKKAQSHNPNEMAQAQQRLTISFKKKLMFFYMFFSHYFVIYI
jgi:hypothetical protein